MNDTPICKVICTDCGWRINIRGLKTREDIIFYLKHIVGIKDLEGLFPQKNPTVTDKRPSRVPPWANAAPTECALCEHLWPAHKLRGALTRDGAMCLICPDCEKEYGEVPLLKLSTKGQQKWQEVCGKK